MPEQPANAGLREAMKKVTRRAQFVAEMDSVVPWGQLLALIAPHYPMTVPKGARPPLPLETMQWGLFSPELVGSERSDGGRDALAKNRAQFFTLFALGNLFRCEGG